MTVCIDTNVVLTMFKKRHATRPIYEAWAAGRFLWAVSTEVLLEYDEIAARMNGPAYADLIQRTIQSVGAWRANILHIAPTFRFNLITQDPDDNKFADCAIAAEADYIITEDRHFDAMIGLGYKPQPITPEEFIRRYLTGV